MQLDTPGLEAHDKACIKGLIVSVRERMKILFVFIILLFGTICVSCYNIDGRDVRDYLNCSSCPTVQMIYLNVVRGFIINCEGLNYTRVFQAGRYKILVCPVADSFGDLGKLNATSSDVPLSLGQDYTCTDYRKSVLLIAALEECEDYLTSNDTVDTCDSFELYEDQNCCVTNIGGQCDPSMSTTTNATTNATTPIAITTTTEATTTITTEAVTPITTEATTTTTNATTPITTTGNNTFSKTMNLNVVLIPTFLFLLLALLVAIIVVISVICFLKIRRKQINKEGQEHYASIDENTIAIELAKRIDTNNNTQHDTNPTIVTQESGYTDIMEHNLDDRISTNSKDSLGSRAINTSLRPLEQSAEPCTPTSAQYGLVRNSLYEGFVEGELVDTKLYQELPCMKNQHRDSMEVNPLYNSRELALQGTPFIEPSSSIPELQCQCCLYEIEESDLVMGDMFASGQFGLVYRATYKTGKGEIPVAVKALKESANKDTRISFMQEAATMAQFNHPNVLRLIGVITTQQACMIVTELLKTELRELLIKFRDVPESGDIPELMFKFTREIADAMEYLAKKNFVHRDLAARNVLVAKDLTIRVADFGMSREVVSENNYYTSSGGIVPLRWTAPEAVFYKKFSEKTDVWSFGMTLFEIWSLGEKPWGEASNNEIIENISMMKTHSLPPGCPEGISRVMLETWKYDKNDRPTFSEVREMLSTVALSIKTSNSPI